MFAACQQPCAVFRRVGDAHTWAWLQDARCWEYSIRVLSGQYTLPHTRSTADYISQYLLCVSSHVRRSGATEQERSSRELTTS